VTEVDKSSAIRFSDVHLSRGGVPVLRGFTIDIAAGDTLALVGRSGAGKSTILKLINRLLLPESGDVLVESRSTHAGPVRGSAVGRGCHQQEVGLFPPEYRGEHRDGAPAPELGRTPDRFASASYSELVGLDAARLRQAAGPASGGQRQRVGVARAPGGRSASPLDGRALWCALIGPHAEIHREFRRIQQHVRKTVVLVTHDMAEAFALGTHVGVLADGALALVGEPSAVAQSTDVRVRPLLEPLLEAADVLRPAR
jgi:osmoprotectant transport system ATP-binding protein